MNLTDVNNATIGSLEALPPEEIKRLAGEAKAAAEHYAKLYNRLLGFLPKPKKVRRSKKELAAAQNTGA